MITSSRKQDSQYKSDDLQNIIVDYDGLRTGKNYTQLIQRAFGPKGHGILLVKGIPGYPEARKALLRSIWKMGNLPTEILAKYEKPQICHTRGWSKGKEQYEGQYDLGKGSFYINCCTDEPLEIPEEDKKHYTKQQLELNIGNIWIDQMPEIKENVKNLSKLMIQVGELLAKQIDSAASQNVKNYQNGRLTKIIREGKVHIGRMLHYFPYSKVSKSTQADWCGWHNDHGALTALTSAMYIDKDGNEISLNKPEGGLYAKNRFGEIEKISIPPDMLAFQLGEVSQIITGGYLQATPHCVQKSSEIAGKGISRETFALFMQPYGLEKLQVPEGISQEDLTLNQAYKVPDLKKRWKNGIFFKDFHNETIKNYS